VTLFVGHRGASTRALENTMAAFEAAREDGADGVELDVRLTRDGALAVFHDDDLTRLAGRGGCVEEMTWREVERVELRGGERIPRLDQVLEAMDGLLVNVEIKPPRWRRAPAVVRAVADCVARAGTGAGAQVIVSSFDVAVVGLTRAMTPLRVGILFHDRQRRPLRRAWLAPVLRVHAVHPKKTLVDQGTMRAWRSAGYEVNVWTVDEAVEVRRLVRLGVDAIISNDPAAARRAMEEV
jgi:glycerophosphoryl diester phosphodiesterase